MIAIATNEPHEIDVKCQQEHWNCELNWYLQTTIILQKKLNTKQEKPHKSEKVSNMIKTLKPLLPSGQHLYEDDMSRNQATVFGMQSLQSKVGKRQFPFLQLH